MHASSLSSSSVSTINAKKTSDDDIQLVNESAEAEARFYLQDVNNYSIVGRIRLKGRWFHKVLNTKMENLKNN